MKRVVVATVLLAPVAVAAGVAIGDTSNRAAGRTLADAELRISSQGVSRTLGPDSFCAAPNGEPITLACGGRLRAPRGTGLPVRSGARISLRFGASVERVSVRYARAAGKRGVVVLTYAMPLREAGEGRNSHTVVSTDPSMLKRVTIVILSVTYAEPVPLRLPDRTSRPFKDASAEFAVPVRARR